MTAPNHPDQLTHADLAARYRHLQSNFTEDLSVRLYRALSWLDRAEQERARTPLHPRRDGWLARAEQERERQDADTVVIFYWICFNSLYATPFNKQDEQKRLDEQRHTGQKIRGERDRFNEFFEQIVAIDQQHKKVVYDLLWKKFNQEIRLLLDNRYIFEPFWRHHSGEADYGDWENRFKKSQQRVLYALRNSETHVILSILFDRLYVLRNQLLHGGATWKSSKNRTQVNDGSRILESLLPHFIDLMMDNPTIDLNKSVYYPPLDD